MKNIFKFINFYILTLWGFVMVISSFAAPKLFWSDWGNNKIQSANIDGTGVQDLVTGLSSAKGNVAIDTENNKVYWIDRGTGFLQKQIWMAQMWRRLHPELDQEVEAWTWMLATDMFILVITRTTISNG